MNQLLRDITHRHRHVDPELVHELVELQTAALIEGRTEAVNVFAREAEPGREGMAAELREEIRHLGEALRHRVGIDASTGALRHEGPVFSILGVGDHEGRTVILLAEAPGDDAGEALMQLREVDDEDRIRAVLLLYLRIGFLRRLDRHVLPDIVQLLQLHRLREGLRRVRGGKERQCDLGTAEPAACIDTRADDIADVVTRDVLLLEEALHVEQRAEARVRRLADLLEAELHDDTVLVLELDDVTDGRDGGELEEVEVRVLREPAVLVEQGDDLPGDDRTADLGIRVAAVLALRVHDGTRRRQDIPRLAAVVLVVALTDVMVVRNQYGKAEVTRMLHLLDGTDAVVAGEDHADAILLRLVDDVHVDAVAVPDPVRQHVVDLRTEAPEAGVEDVGRAHAIDVVVADDADTTALLDRAVQMIHAADRIRQEERRVELLEGAMQVLLDLRVGVDLTVPEDTCRHLIDVVRRRDRLEIRLLIIDEPFFHMLSLWVLLYDR